MNSILKYADDYGIEKPSSTLQKGRLSINYQRAKRLRVDLDPMCRYQIIFKDILAVFINHLSKNFN